MKKTLKGFKFTLKLGKTLLLVFFLLLHGYFCTAQDEDSDKEGDDIKAVRMAYMTDQLKLTPEEAQKFWPVYNNYLQDIRRAKKENAGNVVKQQEAVVNIKKRYQQNFRKVVGSEERTNRVFSSEIGFRDILRKEWQKRHPNGANNNNRQQQMQQMRQMKQERKRG